MTRLVTCSTCDGKGFTRQQLVPKQPYAEVRCTRCNGTGNVAKLGQPDRFLTQPQMAWLAERAHRRRMGLPALEPVTPWQHAQVEADIAAAERAATARAAERSRPRRGRRNLSASSADWS